MLSVLHRVIYVLELEFGFIVWNDLLRFLNALVGF